MKKISLVVLAALIFAMGLSTADSVVWNSPLNDTWNASQTITHTYTPTADVVEFDNCSLWSNVSGTFALKASNSTPIVNDTENTIDYNYATDSSLILTYINCTNSSGDSVFTDNVTIKIESDQKMNISDCSNLDLPGVTYYLTANINTSSFCMDISADNITLDCQGFTIDGEGSDTAISVSQLIASTTNTTVKNCKLNYFGDGIILGWASSELYANDSTIFNNTITSMTSAGIYFSNSSNDEIYNNTIENCRYGIILDNFVSIINNIFYNNIIQDSTDTGISLDASESTCHEGNSFYNNLINNTVNMYMNTMCENYWNTTQQAGTRIYSPGTDIGGNYWTNSSGDGYSDTCADVNSDGFCDASLDLCGGSCGTNNTDYLPLEYDLIAPATTPSANSSTGSYTFGTWASGPYVNISLSCADSGVGCDTTEYCLDPFNNCVPDTVYTDVFQITSEGATYVRFRSNDTNGNLETTQSRGVALDRTPPVSNTSAANNDSSAYTFGTWTSSTYVNVTMDCTDVSGSGCAYTTYCLDLLNTCTPDTLTLSFPDIIPVSTEGISYIRFNSSDAADPMNIEDVQNKTLEIDTTPPSQVTGLVLNSTGSAWIKVAWDAATDTGGSGIQTYLIWRDGVNIANTTDLFYNDTAVGMDTLHCTSYSYIVGAIDDVDWFGSNSTALDVPATCNLDFSIAWNSPQTNTWNASKTIKFGYTITFKDGEPSNCSVWTNRTGSFALAASNSTALVNASVNNITYAFAADSNKIFAYINCTNSSGDSNFTANITVKIDSTAPSQVTNLASGSKGTTWIYLTWTASTDAGIGVAKYMIWRDGVNVDNSTNAYYNSTGLANGVSYHYIVSAVDYMPWYGSNSSTLTIATLAAPGFTGGGGGGTTLYAQPSGENKSGVATGTVTAKQTDYTTIALVVGGVLIGVMVLLVLISRRK